MVTKPPDRQQMPRPEASSAIQDEGKALVDVGTLDESTFGGHAESFASKEKYNWGDLLIFGLLQVF